MSTDGIKPDIPSNQDYLAGKASQGALKNQTLKLAEFGLGNASTIAVDEESLEVQFDLRGCEPGEELLSSGKCRKCDAGQYLLVASSNSPQTCKDCP